MGRLNKKKNTTNIQPNNVQQNNQIQNNEPMAYRGVLDSDISNRMAKKEEKRQAKKAKLAEKIDMYDMIIANLIAGNTIIAPSKHLGNSNIRIGFSNISSDTQISKYFLIRQFPDYLQTRLFDSIRRVCIRNGVKINFYIYGGPYKINWDSAEMRNKMTVWKRYTEENSGASNVFEYRTQRTTDLAKKRIILSTKYWNDAELNQKRSLIRAAFLIEVTGANDDESILNMMDAIQSLKEFCSQRDIKLRELKINMIDWLQCLGPLCLREKKEISNRLPYKVLTDDLLSNFNSYKQGRIGVTGIPLGMDIESNVPVLRKIKADPDAAENWLVSAGTGGGKSYWTKVLLTFLLADDFVVTVMDYEGDEYSNIAAYIRECNKNDVKVISMGKGSTTYFDPCEIPRLTGDAEVDKELKEQATNYILAIFRVIVAGLDENLNIWEEKVISTAIRRMYESAGVTSDISTWHRSKGLRLSMVYEELKYIVESKELVDSDADNVQHKAAVKIVNAASIYFEEGESKSGAFKNPMSADELYEAKFIVFSFGMRGAGDSTMDPTLLALKQLSVASVTIQISNYCKYVRHCFNVKVWEEYQRWSQASGSAEIISNAMTGGRKRGDVNFIITNDLANIIDDNNEVSKKLRQNIQNFAIGKIPDRCVREQFCNMFDLKDCLLALDKIAKAHSSDDLAGSNKGTGNRYKHSFCLIMDNGKKAVVKAMIPPSLARSDLFKTGVVI